MPSAPPSTRALPDTLRAVTTSSPAAVGVSHSQPFTVGSSAGWPFTRTSVPRAGRRQHCEVAAPLEVEDAEAHGGGQFAGPVERDGQAVFGGLGDDADRRRRLGTAGLAQRSVPRATWGCGTGCRRAAASARSWRVRWHPGPRRARRAPVDAASRAAIIAMEHRLTGVLGSVRRMTSREGSVPIDSVILSATRVTGNSLAGYFTYVLQPRAEHGTPPLRLWV